MKAPGNRYSQSGTKHRTNRYPSMASEKRNKAMEGSCGGKWVRLTAVYAGLKRLNARRQPAYGRAPN